MAGTFQFAQSCIPDEAFLGPAATPADGQFPPDLLGSLGESANSGAGLGGCAQCPLCDFFPFIVTDCFADRLAGFDPAAGGRRGFSCSSCNFAT